MLTLWFICAFRENIQVLMRKIGEQARPCTRRHSRAAGPEGTYGQQHSCAIARAPMHGWPRWFAQPYAGARLPVLLCTAVRRWFSAIYCRVSIVLGVLFGWGVWSASIRVSLSLSQTTLGGNKLG